MKLVSPIPPSVNHYLAYRSVLKAGRPVAMSYKTSEAVKYQSEFAEYVKEEVKKQKWTISKNKFQHYYMDCVFYFPRIDLDANNYFKCLADAITQSQCVWIDDTQLCERVQRIYYTKEDPHIEIEISPVSYIGIFSDISHLDAFRSKCIQCRRYKDGKCSLLQKALEGRLQKEIVGYKCRQYKVQGEK